MGNKYVTVPISNYNSAPPSDDASQTDANKVKWSTHKTKIGDPLNAAIAAIDAALVTRFDESAQLKTAGYTTTLADHQKLIEVTGTNTILLLDASTGAAGYQINVLNTGAGIVTVGRATAGNTINGVAQNWTLNPGNGASFRVNSTNNGYHAISTSGSGDGLAWGGSAGGTADALTISMTPALTAYAAGQTFRFRTNLANTGAATLSINGLAAQAITKDGGGALVANDMPGSAVMQVVSLGTEFRLIRTSGTSLTDVLHTTGNETIGGVKTFTTGSPIAMSSTVPAIQGRNTSLTLPAGAWRMLWPASDDTFYLQKNTAGAGDFSTVTNLFYIGSTQAAFGVPVTIPNGVTSSDAVNKSQLDAKVYGGQVNSAGTAVYLPSGWSSVKNSTGNYTITHNLGTTNYAPVITAAGGGTHAAYFALATNSFQVATTNTGSLIDAAFAFTVARN